MLPTSARKGSAGVRAEFYRPDAPEQIVGRAVWTGSGVELAAEEGAIAEALARIVRRTSVAVDDSALRTAGTLGPVVLQPGGLLWFIHAARSRSGAEGLAVRLVPEAAGGTGWDPAAAYRTFSEAIDRTERLDGAVGS